LNLFRGFGKRSNPNSTALTDLQNFEAGQQST